MAIMKYTEWQSGSGNWYCTDTSNMAGGSAKWWLPCRMLNISPADFVKKLKEEFKATDIVFDLEKNVLIYSWNNKEDCHKFVLYINRKSREANYVI